MKKTSPWKRLIRKKPRTKKRSAGRIVFSALFLLVTVLFGAALLVSFFSQYVSPNKIWFAPFLGIPYPYLYLCNGMIFIFWLIRRHRYAWVSLIAGIITLSSIGHYVQWPFGSTNKDSDAMRFLSYNINYFTRNDGGKGYSVDTISQLIRQDSFDIVCLQEFRVEEDRFHIAAFEDKIKPLKFITSSNNLTNRRRFGTAIFSRYPAIDEGYIEFSESSNSAVYADIVFPNHKTVRIYSVHFESISFSSKAKSLLSGDVLTGSTTPPDINQTLFGMYSKMRRAYQKRAIQVVQLSAHINSSPYPVVVCGDFNDMPVSYTYNTIRGDLVDPFISVGHGIMTTFIKAIFPLRIDYILHDASFTPLQYYSPRVHWSDHYPVVLHLKMPA